MDIGPLLLLLVGFRVVTFHQRRARDRNQKLEKCYGHAHIISRGKLSSCIELGPCGFPFLKLDDASFNVVGDYSLEIVICRAPDTSLLLRT